MSSCSPGYRPEGKTGMAKKTERKVKNIIPTIEGLGQDLKDFFNGLSDKSDRDVALAMCAYLDDTLNSMFRKVLIDEGKPEGDFIQSIMKGYGPLSDFRARIALAYALGWFGQRVRERLDTIRGIRNQFAHHYKIDSFEHPDVAAECDKLLPDLQFDHLNLSRRNVFMLTATNLSQSIAARALSLIRPPEGPNFEITQHFIFWAMIGRSSSGGLSRIQPAVSGPGPHSGACRGVLRLTWNPAPSRRYVPP
jgi:hypothetical protein